MAEPPFPLALERFPRVRQSILSTFDNCGLAARWDLEYRQGWSSHPAAAGILCHRVFGKCLAAMVEQRESSVPVDVALAVFDESLRQHDVPMDGDLLETDVVVTLPAKWVAEARIIVKTWAMYSMFTVEHIAGVERRLDTTLVYPDENGEAVERVVTGRPDVLLINGPTATVLDWKTGWGIPSEGLGRASRDAEREAMASAGDNISEEGYFWMRFYALLVFRRYPRIQRVVLQEVYPRYLSGRAKDRRGRPINPVRQATIDRYVLGEIETEFSALVERFDRSVQTNIWRPSPGSHCSYCPRPEACTIFPAARAAGRITTPEEAEIAGGRLNVLDALSEQTRAALRSWSKNFGDVPVRDAKRPRVFGPVVRTRTIKPDAEQLARHIAQGGKPEDLFRTEEYVQFCVHSPEEVHPQAHEARREEQALLEMERAAAARRGTR